MFLLSIPQAPECSHWLSPVRTSSQQGSARHSPTEVSLTEICLVLGGGVLQILYCDGGCQALAQPGRGGQAVPGQCDLGWLREPVMWPLPFSEVGALWGMAMVSGKDIGCELVQT